MSHIPKQLAYPVGYIIAVHPEVAVSPNSNYWLLCDGVEELGAKFNNPTTKVPDLTDMRFLAGISTTTASSLGSNVMTDHLHSSTNQDTSHCHYVNPDSKTSGGRSVYHCHLMVSNVNNTHDYTASTAKYMIRCDVHTILNNSYSLRNHTTIPTIGRTYIESPNHCHATNPVSTTSGTQTASHSHTAGSGSAVGSTSIIPQYFTVNFYIRVK